MNSSSGSSFSRFLVSWAIRLGIAAIIMPIIVWLASHEPMTPHEQLRSAVIRDLSIGFGAIAGLMLVGGLLLRRRQAQAPAN